MTATNIIMLESVASTNDYVKARAETLPDGTVVIADEQTAGRGQGSNGWEAEAGKDLTFSILIKPRGIKASRQFIYSKAMALAVSDALDEYIVGFRVKWPNDIYWKDKKISGTLIECAVAGDQLRWVIIGTGININQTAFLSGAPNPVSLSAILGRGVDRMEVLDKVMENMKGYLFMIDHDDDSFISDYYMMSLYRSSGFHAYRDRGGLFMAEIKEVADDGRLWLTLTDGSLRRYAFKEVEYVINE